MSEAESNFLCLDHASVPYHYHKLWLKLDPSKEYFWKITMSLTIPKLNKKYVDLIVANEK